MNKYKILLVLVVCALFLTPVALAVYLNFSMTGMIVDTGRVTYFLDDGEFMGGFIDWGTVEINSTYSKGLHVNNYKNSPQTPMLVCDDRQGLTVTWSLNNTEVPARTWRDGVLTLKVADTLPDGNFSFSCQLFP